MAKSAAGAPLLQTFRLEKGVSYRLRHLLIERQETKQAVLRAATALYFTELGDQIPDAIPDPKGSKYSMTMSLTKAMLQAYDTTAARCRQKWLARAGVYKLIRTWQEMTPDWLVSCALDRYVTVEGYVDTPFSKHYVDMAAWEWSKRSRLKEPRMYK